MSNTSIRYSDKRVLPLDSLLELYQENAWSAADKPGLLHQALLASHSLITAWDGGRLVGLGNAISDGYLVVYYPHLLVLPAYQRRGIGTEIIAKLTARYQGFHQHMLVADVNSLDFYSKCGFEPAGQTQAMWIYAGKEH